MNAARPRNSALEKLVELRFIILEHIIKISVLPHHAAVQHWQAEVNSFGGRLKRYHKGKGSKPNFNEELLWEYLWEDQVSELPLGFIDEYGLKKIELDVEDIKSRLRFFIKEVLS